MSDQQSRGTLKVAYQSWVDRNGFPEWFMALLWIVISFFLFQTIGPLVFIVLLSTLRGVNVDLANLTGLLEEHLDLLFWGNSTGQILVILMGTILIVRLHAQKRNRSEYLRWRMLEGGSIYKYALLAALLVVAMQPMVWFLGWINALLPLPDGYMQMEQMQTKVLQDYLSGSQWLGVTLFHVALVPAICEEVLFRGYLQRAVERSGSVGMGILISGVLFGFYHLRFSQVIPLAVIGILLALITWRTRSLIPAMIAHLVNNAGGILLVAYFPESSFVEVTPDAAPPVWLVVLSIVVSVAIFWYFYDQTVKDHGTNPT
jgi:membrane protease YdiL (CAAX protease family)